MMQRSRRRKLATTAGMVAVLTVGIAAAGCASIPGAGQVEVGLSDLRQAEQIVQFSASGPVSGATQEQLVRGFLTAANSPADNYAVAREYLTSTYADQWDPYYGALVGDGSRPYRSGDAHTGVLSVSVVAQVDSAGTLLPAEAGASTELRFEFEQQGSEWRISSAPSGVIVDRTTFLAIWSSHQLYFLGAGDRLVPDTRWFLANTSLPTAMVSALLQGPSEQLNQVVHSGFGPGVRLARNAVPIADGLARVDLTGDGLGEASAQQQMLRQLQSSLQTVAGVNRVELLIDGNVVRGGGETPPPTQTPNAGNKLTVMIDGRFGVMSGTNVEPVTGISQTVDGLDPWAAALSRSKTLAAVLSGDGVTLVSDTASTVIDARPKLLGPSVDDDLWTWTVSAASPTTLHATSANGAQRDLQAPWLAGKDVRALRLSPTGTLIAALVTEGEKSSVMVAGVLREENGSPTGLTGEPDTVMWASGEAIDLDWVDQLRVVVLTRQGTAGKVTVGGPGLFATEQGSVPDAVAVSGGGGRASMRVLSSDGDLYAPQGGSGWQRVASDIELLAKRG